jgi:hypothetical protein
MATHIDNSLMVNNGLRPFYHYGGLNEALASGTRGYQA